MDTGLIRASGGHAWLGYLAGGILVITAYFLAVATDAPPVLRVTLYCAVSMSAAIAVFVGRARSQPARQLRLPWLFLGLSQVIYAIADICFYVAHDVFENTDFPAMADPLYLSHYPLVVVGLILLIRLRTPGRDLPSLLDAATLAVVAGMLSYLYLIAPQAWAYTTALVKIVSVAYPVMDLAMFAVSLRLIFAPGRKPLSFVLLAGNLLVIFTADSVYVVQQLANAYVAGNFLDGIWLSGNLLLGASALHPTMSVLTEPAPVSDTKLSPHRLAAVLLAVLIAPATLVLRYWFGSVQDIPVIGGACAALFVLTIARLAGLITEQRRLATTDVLTGLRTRRFFVARLPLEIEKARRAGQSLAVLIVDVDHFKSINDRYGHPAGDKVLVEIARRLRDSVRDADLLARYGGEEFALVLPDTDPQILASIGERLRHHVASMPIAIGPETWKTATVSVGTASYPRHGTTPAELITSADRALYAAKSEGRDRVVVGETRPLPPTPTGIADTDMLVYLQHVADEVDGWLSGCEHGRAVGRWAALVAAELGVKESMCGRIELSGRLHDIGKIMVPESIWRKPAALSKQERRLVQLHPDYGFQLVRVVPDLHDVAETILQHHERFDGKGYPAGLAGAAIRIEARIVAVCDSWAAMLANRPYHTALTIEQARDQLVLGRGSQFDPDVVAAFLRLQEQGRIDGLGLLSNLHRPARPSGARPTASHATPTELVGAELAEQPD
jgi:two-component system cell cycle response regulator